MPSAENQLMEGEVSFGGREQGDGALVEIEGRFREKSIGRHETKFKRNKCKYSQPPSGNTNLEFARQVDRLKRNHCAGRKKKGKNLKGSDILVAKKNNVIDEHTTRENKERESH